MRHLPVHLLLSVALSSAVLAINPIDAIRRAANTVWVAYYYPDVAVDLVDAMHRPTVSLEDPIPIDNWDSVRR